MSALLQSARRNVPLAPYTTLKAGGPVDSFVVARNVDELAEAAIVAQQERWPMLVLGWGSNLLPADAGVPGLAVLNLAASLTVSENGEVEADAGCSFQELFLKTAQAGLGGLEFAVGIPGTVGGALVSNAGAYRSNVSEFLTEIEIVEGGERRWVSPAWMEFSYRDSKLRKPDPPACALLRVRMKLARRPQQAIYDEARDYQRQRIGKQPPPASAGSFFKNVTDFQLAQTIPGLTEGMRKNGVVPAGFLIEMVGLKGCRHGGCRLSPRHANFMLNTNAATATEIYELAQLAIQRVEQEFGVRLEEEVLYIGRWPHLASSVGQSA